MTKPLSKQQHLARPQGWGRTGLSNLLSLVIVAVLLVAGGYQWGHRSGTTSALQAPSNNTTPAQQRTSTEAIPSNAESAASSDGAASTALADLLSAPPVRRLDTIAYSALPTEGRAILGRIVGSYDFDHDKDGTVFGNREGLLPSQKRGYYREYTVPTPGLSHRGALRLVCGGQQPRQPNHCFYTADHYASFRQVVR